MNTQTLNAIFGGLLHDVGKMVYRAGEKQDHASAGYAYLKEVRASEGRIVIFFNSSSFIVLVL